MNQFSYFPQIQSSIDSATLPPPVEKAEGPLRVEAFTIQHSKFGNPHSGVVIGTLVKSGRRALAMIDATGISSILLY